MKSRLYIIIGIIIIGVIIALTIGTLEYQTEFNQNCHDDNGKVTGFLQCMLIREDFAEPRVEGKMANVADKEELQNVLDDCFNLKEGRDIDLIVKSYTNDTHSIDNIDCKWETPPRGTIPIFEFEDDDLNSKGCPLFCPKDDKTILDQYKDIPEVVAFYAKYDDAQASVREGHVSYFAGSDNDALMRMNIFFDENQTITEIDTHCYFQKVHQYEIPQEDIINRLEKYDCPK